jgi:5-methylcytosine-specific restriction protein A
MCSRRPRETVLVKRRVSHTILSPKVGPYALDIRTTLESRDDHLVSSEAGDRVEPRPTREQSHDTRSTTASAPCGGRFVRARSLLPSRRRLGAKMLKLGICNVCGHHRRLQRDHIVPKWQGGTDDPSNFQDICYDCHAEKTVREFASPEWAARCQAARDADPLSRSRFWNRKNRARQAHLARISNENRRLRAAV